MRLVGFFMDSKIRSGFVVIEAVEAIQAVNLGAGDFWDLRFIGVQRSDCFRDRTIGANAAKRVHDILRARQ